MRKCGACGYLLFGDGETCNHCGTPVPAVGATVGAPSAQNETNANETNAVARAAWPPAAPAPAEPGVWKGPSFTAPSPVPPATAPQPNNDLWRPVVVTPPAAPARKFPTGKVLALAAVLIVAALGFTFVKGRNGVPSGTSDFVAGNGVDYMAADRSYTAQFPEVPAVESAPVTVGNTTISVSMASVTTKSYEMGSASLDFRVKIPQDRVNSVLDEAMNGGISKASGDLVYKHQITRGGLPAIDAKFKAPDGFSAHVLVVLKNSRVYVLFVHAKTGTDKLFEAFDKSFVPQGA